MKILFVVLVILKFLLKKFPNRIEPVKVEVIISLVSSFGENAETLGQSRNFQ